jgi:SsrA-binding protein
MENKRAKNIQIKNRKSQFEYFILDKWTAGIQLLGTEIKPIIEGKANLVDSYCFFDKNELFLKNFEIQTQKNSFQHDPKRLKKLLLKRKELNKIQKGLIQGITIIPLRVFESKGYFKAEIALAKGKKLYDKRETIKEREVKREIDRLSK